ncbi:hypothetical protein EDM57_04815 [Brevibacillus gelatini]|uniref:Uncharacterized protein n=1 Tax=Brevibacillus gelatini TaxID=1655277 RepID=A0A3M8B9P7_9BACL|nr:hypothetical protein EDM57_04815 [Brevibacillus gelatini]
MSIISLFIFGIIPKT